MDKSHLMNNEGQRLCPWRKAYIFDNAIRRIFQNPERIVYPYIEDGSVALDIGCGMGYFSIAMAKVTGQHGRVFSLDIQLPMLNVLMKRAARAGVAEQITPILVPTDEPELPEKADFAVGCWVLHEIKNLPLFLSRIRLCLKPGSGFLVMEPLFHVSGRQFAETIKAVESAEFRLTERPKIGLSHSAFFLASSNV